MPALPDGRTFGQSDRPRLIAIAGLAFLLRLAWIAASGSDLRFADESGHLSIAESIAGGRGFVDGGGNFAQRMPLYPLYLTMFIKLPHGLFLARAGQAVMGAAIALAGYVIGKRLFGRRAGLLAALLLAIDPFLVFFSALLLMETQTTLALTLFMSGIVLIDRTGWRGPLMTAICGTVLVMTRSSAALLVPAMLGWMLFRRRGDAAAWRAAALSAAFLTTALAAWGLRNKARTGEFAALGFNGGYSLYDGVGPGATGASDGRRMHSLPELAGMTEAQRNAHLKSLAIREIRRDPARAVRLAGVKFLRTWSPWPHADEYAGWRYRLISMGWWLPIIILAGFGTYRWRHDAGRLAMLLTPAIYFSMVHMVFVGSVRYRLPAMPGIEVLAAAGLSSLMSRARPELHP